MHFLLLHDHGFIAATAGLALQTNVRGVRIENIANLRPISGCRMANSLYMITHDNCLT
jgi:hypothetical protein